MDIKKQFDCETALQVQMGDVTCPFRFTGDVCHMRWDKCSKCETYIEHLQEQGCFTDVLWEMPEDVVKQTIAIYVVENTMDEEFDADESGNPVLMCPFSMYEVPCDTVGYSSCKVCAKRFHPID